MSESCEAITSSTHEWIPYNYQQQTIDQFAAPNYEGFSDAFSVSGFGDEKLLDHLAIAVPRASAAGGDSAITMVAHDNSCAPSNDLSPKAGSGKPAVRKRSRASRRTPTTLLNASIKDFRALVQLYTGCDTAAASSSSSINLKKGPINLRFGPPNEKKDFAAAAPFGGNFGGRYDNDRVHSQEQDQRYQQEHTQAYQGQQSSFSFSDYPSNSGQNLMPVNHFGWV